MANCLNLSASALPCGFDRAGLSIGLQLIGRAGSEIELIATAWAIEQVLAVPARWRALHDSHRAE